MKRVKLLVILLMAILFTVPVNAGTAKRYIVSCNINHKNSYNTLGYYATVKKAKSAIAKQKKSIRDEFAIYDTMRGDRLVWPKPKTKSTQVKRAVAWAVAVAKDNKRHGYNRSGEYEADNTLLTHERWGIYGDYSCAPLVLTAYELSGYFNVREFAQKNQCFVEEGTIGVKSTNLREVLLATGKFKEIKSFPQKGKKVLKPGDILLHKGKFHTGMYIGDGKIVEAAIKPSTLEIVTAKHGDQSGLEIRIKKFSKKWGFAFRPTG